MSNTNTGGAAFPGVEYKAPIGYAVSVTGMVSMVSCTNSLEDGTYLLHATKISDNVQLAFGVEAFKKLVGEQQ
jgi:hypothetical protein